MLLFKIVFGFGFVLHFSLWITVRKVRDWPKNKVPIGTYPKTRQSFWNQKPQILNLRPTEQQVM